MSKRAIAEIIIEGLRSTRTSKQSFAQLMGVQPSVVSRWITGHNNFTIDILFKIEEVLRVRFFTFSPHHEHQTCFPCTMINFVTATPTPHK